MILFSIATYDKASKVALEKSVTGQHFQFEKMSLGSEIIFQGNFV